MSRVTIKFAILLMLSTPIFLSASQDSGSEKIQASNFVTFYYKNPQPQKLPRLLDQILKDQTWDDPEKTGYDESCLAYFFAIAAADDEDIIKQYTDMFDSLNHSQRVFLLNILYYCSNEQTRDYFQTSLSKGRFANEQYYINDILDAEDFEDPAIFEPIQDVEEIQYAWIDFIATGQELHISRIIDLLKLPQSAPDQIRLKIDAVEILSEKLKRHKVVEDILKQKLKEGTSPMVQAIEEIFNRAKDPLLQNVFLKQAALEQPVTLPHAWALGCGAILNERNHARHDYLSPDLVNEKSIISNRKLLSEWWDINDRQSLFASLDWLYHFGHRVEFNEEGLRFCALTEKQSQELLKYFKDDPEKCDEIETLRKYYKKLGSKSILGWDYCRYICLCRWGYGAGYISEKEAWEKIMPVARELQKTFDSWQDMGKNYLIGRRYWSYRRTKESGRSYSDAYLRLRDMKSSPWNKYPWDSDLSGTVENKTAIKF